MNHTPNDQSWRGRHVAVVVAVAVALATAYLTVHGIALSPGGTLGILAAADRPRALMAVRNVVLASAPLCAIACRAWPSLRVLLVVNAAVQLGDSLLGAPTEPPARTLARVALTIGLAVAASTLRPLDSRRRPADRRRQG